MNFPKLIQSTRHLLGETQTEFGRRFDASYASVSNWELGRDQAPYKVLDFCLANKVEVKIITCPVCKGKGKVDFFKLK